MIDYLLTAIRRDGQQLAFMRVPGPAGEPEMYLMVPLDLVAVH